MQPGDLSTAALVAAGMLAVLCLLGPLVVQARWARRRRWLWASFGLGAATFAVTQLLIRIPLITLVLPKLPEWQVLLGHAVWAAVVLSFSAALFEETGRLIVMGAFLRDRRRTQADGVSFGLGHGGLEAFVLVGLSMVGVVVLGVLVKAGQWPALTASMPPGAAELLRTQLGGLSVLGATAGGLERVAAIALHVGLSVLILAGLVRGRPVAAWLVAMGVHGTVNLVVTVALTVWHWPVLVVESVFLAVAIAAVVWVVRARRLFATPPVRGAEDGGEVLR